MSINISIWNYNIYDFGEPMKFTEYNELDKSSTCVHSDLAQGLTTYRKLTVIAQLSDENSYEGGDVYVQEGSELIQTTKKKGSVIVFPSFLMHCVKPVTKGIRNSIVLFVYGPPFC
jgi:PKHD-type hydroxylase